MEIYLNIKYQMNKKELTNEIKKIGPWFQTIELEKGIITTDIYPTSKRGKRLNAGDIFWPQLRKILPYSIKGLRILELGTDAGLYCVRAAMEGASVVGIDKDKQCLKQAEFIKKYFEDKFSKKIDVRYINGQIENLIDFKLGQFDILIACAVLHCMVPRDKSTKVKKQRKIKLAKTICDISDNILIREKEKYIKGKIEKELIEDRSMNVFIDEFKRNGFKKVVETKKYLNRIVIVYSKTKNLKFNEG